MTDTTTDIFAHTPMSLRREVGARLRARREELGLKRSVVATATGYRNLSKGARRIADREAGIATPLLDEDGYFDVLQMDPAEVRLTLARADGIESRIQYLCWDVVAAERKLLQDHAALLLGSAAAIRRKPVVSNVRSPAVSIRLAWLGGGSLSLGQLSSAWSAGSLVAHTDEHGPVYLFEGAGSPLSGRGRCTGVDRAGALRQIPQAPTCFLRGGLLPGREPAPLSPLSLSDALAMLGARVPEIAFHLLNADAYPEDRPLAVYDPNTRRIRTAAGATRSIDTDMSPAASVRPVHGGVSVGGGSPRPLQLAAGRPLGAFKEDVLEHSCGLRLASGRVEGAGGWFPLKVIGSCPPLGVLPVLAALLAQRQLGSVGKEP